MAEIRLTDTERRLMVAAEHSAKDCACDAICAAVEGILKARLATVETSAREETPR